MPRPVATSKRRTPPAVKKPDLDKCIRAVLDALTGVVLADDSLVVDVHGARKRLADIGEEPSSSSPMTSTRPSWKTVCPNGFQGTSAHRGMC